MIAIVTTRLALGIWTLAIVITPYDATARAPLTWESPTTFFSEAAAEDEGIRWGKQWLDELTR
jgi:hypothetical protein